MKLNFDKHERKGSDEYLIPVYFNKEVLVRYFYDKRFYCELASETFGTIGDETFSICFGINKNGSVIMWLGDILHNTPIREQTYFIIENKEPENDIESEFYEAQVSGKFSDPPIAIKTLNELEMLNSAFEIKYSCYLYKKRSIQERIEEARRYKRIIMNNIDDFKRFVTELNEIINENTNNSALRTLLNAKGIIYDSESKGNKLLEKVYTSILGDSRNLIAPFYYLYDLRLWASHKGKEGVIEDITNKLGLARKSDFENILHALLKKLLISISALSELVN